MICEFRFNCRFENDLQKLDNISKKIALKKIKQVSQLDNLRLMKKLLKGNLGMYWCCRAGTYRIITAIEDSNFVVTTISVGHRKNVYNYSEP